MLGIDFCREKLKHYSFLGEIVWVFKPCGMNYERNILVIVRRRLSKIQSRLLSRRVKTQDFGLEVAKETMTFLQMEKQIILHIFTY